MESSSSFSFEIVHFNDVYNVESRSREPVGGAARFVGRINTIRDEAAAQGRRRPIVVFSGDAFNPSLMSTVTQGKQMIPVLNGAGVEVAVFGNHDFDFGVGQLETLAGQCNFPWLMSNVVDKTTGKKLAEGKETVILDVDGHKIGFVGVVESEWLATLATIDLEDVDYEDYCTCSRRLAADLRQAGCEMVVALSHMRVPNDVRLATECGDVIDLVLGGHDHHYAVEKYGEHNTYVCKSGTDFRQMTVLRVELTDGCRPIVADWRCENITMNIEEDEKVSDELKEYIDLMGAKMDAVVGYTCVPLECRFKMIRTQETNIANFIADVMRRSTGADVAILNTGSIRADTVIDAGPLRMKDLVSLLPMMDALTVLEMTGSQILQALENGVSLYPRLEGRFPAVSGVQFSFDASLEPRQRIVQGSVTVNKKPLENDKQYTVTTKGYLAHGKDGYDVFSDAKVLLDEEIGPLMPTLLRNTFTELEVLDALNHRKKAVMRGAEQWKKLANIQESTLESTDGCCMMGIRPVVEGRIKCLNPLPVL